jgi:hypothetical protein
MQKMRDRHQLGAPIGSLISQRHSGTVALVAPTREGTVRPLGKQSSSVTYNTAPWRSVTAMAPFPQVRRRTSLYAMWALEHCHEAGDASTRLPL